MRRKLRIHLLQPAYVRRKLRIYLKLFLSLSALATLLITSPHANKLPEPSHPRLEPKKKDQLASALTPKKSDDNSFLFVDCTGFFE